MERLRHQFVQALRILIGCEYIWGIQDCSETVNRCLWFCGFKDLGDRSAAGLLEYFHTQKIVPAAAQPGCLLFYGESPTRISHVMAVLERWENGSFTIAGARGGGPTTTSAAAAARQRAFVDVVFGDYWKESLRFVVDPFARKPV